MINVLKKIVTRPALVLASAALLAGCTGMHLGIEAEDEKIREMVTRTINTAKKGGRYIFGTSGGLHQGLPAEKVRTMYQAARQASFY